MEPLTPLVPGSFADLGNLRIARTLAASAIWHRAASVLPQSGSKADEGGMVNRQ